MKFSLLYEKDSQENVLIHRLTFSFKLFNIYDDIILN